MLSSRYDTIIGDIPNDWQVKHLRDLLTKSYSGEWGFDEGEQAVSILRSTNFTKSGTLNYCNVATRYFKKEKAATFGLYKGDLLIERSGGGPEQPVGRVGFIRNNIGGTSVSNFIHVLRPDSQKIDSEYLGWVLYELQRTGIIERFQQQSTQMRNLNWRDYQRLLVPQPSLSEQHCIASALHITENCINMAKLELKSIQILKKSLMSELIQKGIPKKHRKFIETYKMIHPSEWNVTKLKKCGTWSAGGTPDRGNQAYYEGSIPWVKSGEVNYCIITRTEEHVSEIGAKQTTCGILPVGTLLVAMYGAGITRGRVALLGVPATTNQAIASFNGNNHVNNDFMYFWFEFYYNRIRSWAAGSNQDNLSSYLLKNLPIALPEHEEQIEIVNILKSVDDCMLLRAKMIDFLQQIKVSLLQNLLTGKIRIPEGAIDV